MGAFAGMQLSLLCIVHSRISADSAGRDCHRLSGGPRDRTLAWRRRRAFLVASLLANVGILAAFKYFNFLNGNVRALAEALHWNYPVRDLGWLLPIGLSFHTFQSMSYTIEVYLGRQKAERHLGIYALYVMFYPQLVAGPIERPQHLLHQFREYHAFDADRTFSGSAADALGIFQKAGCRGSPCADRGCDLCQSARVWRRVPAGSNLFLCDPDLLRLLRILRRRDWRGTRARI